jgi:hypothetical protein
LHISLGWASAEVWATGSNEACRIPAQLTWLAHEQTASLILALQAQSMERWLVLLDGELSLSSLLSLNTSTCQRCCGFVGRCPRVARLSAAADTSQVQLATATDHKQQQELQGWTYLYRQAATAEAARLAADRALLASAAGSSGVSDAPRWRAYAHQQRRRSGDMCVRQVMAR